MKVGRKKFLWLREGADDAVGIYHFQTVTNCHALIASGSKALGLAWVFEYGEFAIFAREIVRVPFLRRVVAEILKQIPTTLSTKACRRFSRRLALQRRVRQPLPRWR